MNWAVPQLVSYFRYCRLKKRVLLLFTISPHTVDNGGGAATVDDGLILSGDGAAREERKNPRETRKDGRISPEIWTRAPPW